MASHSEKSLNAANNQILAFLSVAGIVVVGLVYAAYLYIWPLLHQEVQRGFLFLLGLIVFAALNAAYLVWLERKEAAHIQRRIGPKEVGPFGLIQPLVDGIKLMTKQLIIPDHVDKPLFMLAPIMLLVPAVMSFVVIPFGPDLVARDINIGLLLIFAFASVNVLGILLGGWASGNKYAVISATRAVSQNVAYEIPMLITVITVVMLSGTLNLNEIVIKQAGGFWNWYIFANPVMWISFIIFFICSLAETNRAPFDLGEAESELIAGYHTEYAGMGFGLFFMGEYANIVIGCSLATVLFLGGWQSPLPFLPSSGLWGLVWFLLKLYGLIFTVVWIRWVYPRVTIYGLLNLSWKVLIPFSLFILLVTGALIKVL